MGSRGITYCLFPCLEKPPLGSPADENSISPQSLDDTKWDQWQIIKDQDWLGDSCHVPTFFFLKCLKPSSK